MNGEFLKLKVLTVSGYQPMELNIYDFNDARVYYLKMAIERRLENFIDEGLEWILLSGQIGVELWTAEVVLEMQNSYDLKLALIPPFKNQEKRWPDAYQHTYQELIYAADFYQPIYKDDYKGPYQFRAKNKFFVNKSDGCLLLMDEEFPGSTKYFHEIAKQKDNYPIYFISPMDVEEVVEDIQMTDPDNWN